MTLHPLQATPAVARLLGRAAILSIAEDIRANYGPTLAGDDRQWDRIARLKAEPPRPPHLP